MKIKLSPLFIILILYILHIVNIQTNIIVLEYFTIFYMIYNSVTITCDKHVALYHI